MNAKKFYTQAHHIQTEKTKDKHLERSTKEIKTLITEYKGKNYIKHLIKNHAKREWSEIFRVLKEKPQPQNSIPSEICFKTKREIKTKQKT